MSCQCCCYRCRERIYFNHRVGCPCTGLIPQLSLRSRCPRNLNLLKTYQPRTINSWWGDLRDTFRSRTGRLTCMLFRRYLCILDLHWGLRILGSLWPHRSSLNRRPPNSSGSKHRLYRRLITTMNDAHSLGKLGQENTFFNRRVSTTNHDDFFSSEEEAITGGAIRNPSTNVIFLAWNT